MWKVGIKYKRKLTNLLKLSTFAEFSFVSISFVFVTHAHTPHLSYQIVRVVLGRDAC